MPVSASSDQDRSSVQGQQALPAPPAQKQLPEPHETRTGDPGAARPARNRGGLLRKLALVLFLLAAGAFAFWRIHGNQQAASATAAKTAAAANRPVPVTMSPVLSKTMPIYLSELGTVAAYNTVTIKSRVDGQLLSVNVREGQQVKQGQVLAMIDPRPYLATQAQAEGQLAKDQAAAAYSKAEAGRYSALYQAGVVSKESEQTQVSNAGQSVGTLDADRAAIQAARVNVAYTRITSPINGVVGLRQVDAGNIVHAADTTGLLVVTQLQPISVIFTLPEDVLQQVLKLVRSGHKLDVEAFDRSEATHLASGALLTVDNEIDPTTGTVKAKAVFDNKDGALFPNQFVNVRLILEQRQNSLVIPAAALQTGSQGTFVYVVKPGSPPRQAGDDSASAGAPAANPAKGRKTAASNPTGQGGPATDDSASGPGAKPRPKYFVDVQNVAVDLTEGSQVILKSGVNSGDQVVIDGQEKLKKYSLVDPSPGRSNAGGPSTQQIGTIGTSSSTPAQSSSPDQPQPAPPMPGRRRGANPSPAGAGPNAAPGARQ